MERVKEHINYLVDCFLEIIYPREEKCYVCNKEEENIICNRCKNKIQKIEESFLIYGCQTFICSYYSFIVKDLILRFKYKGDFHAGEILKILLEDKIREANIKIDYITFVPVAKDALKKKEFNQCEYLARELGKDLDIKVIKLLEKKNKVKEQKTLSKEEREKNIRGAFKLSFSKGLEGCSILLLDDVITTGSTLKSCIIEIKKIKDIKIFLLTIAKSNI